MQTLLRYKASAGTVTVIKIYTTTVGAVTAGWEKFMIFENDFLFIISTKKLGWQWVQTKLYPMFLFAGSAVGSTNNWVGIC